MRLLLWIIETIGETRGVDYEVETIREGLSERLFLGIIENIGQTAVVDCKTETVGHIIVAVYKAGTT